ncbi:MAG: putative phosphoketolase [Candidatus Dojkabacteria bacterium]|nr:MAG: putative phosphoketolase [Candidatus Dojkabacteria bacterium]
MNDIQILLKNIKNYHRLTNYVSAAMLYLKDNFFLEETLEPDHIKERILGHWGTVPGLNFIYAGLNYLAQKEQVEILPVIGPGHGAPAILSNLILEGTLNEYCDGYLPNKEGLSRLIKEFSWPNGFPSHPYPGVPGTIHEGGELGYSLGTAFGIAFDNPGLIVAAVFGDGEAETGPLMASFQSNKFLNPITDGVVLPIFHLNGYRISGPTVWGTMSKEEIEYFFKGLSYEVIWVDQYEGGDVYIDLIQALLKSYEKIIKIKKNWSTYSVSKPIWPLIVIKTKKGWGIPNECKSKKLEDCNNCHGIPLNNPKTDSEEFRVLKIWLESYRIHELLDDEYNPKKEVLSIIPKQENLKLGFVTQKYANFRRKLIIPNLEEHTLNLKDRGVVKEKNLEKASYFLKDIIKFNENNFYVFSPDESESNRLEPLFEITNRKYIWPLKKHDLYFKKDGRILEILSEHVLMEWYTGFVLSGRWGVYVSYEAFLNIISSQIDQFLKYVKQAKNISWRRSIPAMTFISTSTAWRQDHNGFTHQNPSLINNLITKQGDCASVYFPADANIALFTFSECLTDYDRVNLIVIGKRDNPQWLTQEEARKHVAKGLSIWDWASTASDESEIDIVLASVGDYQTVETLAAISILKNLIPEIKLRYVNLNEITPLGIGNDKSKVLNNDELNAYFTKDKPIILNFHGYPEVIKQLTWGHEISNRLTILGYREEGTTTTPFDMQVLNGTSRFHIAIQAIEKASEINSKINAQKDEAITYLANKINQHKKYIFEHGDDMPEIKNWKW